MKIKLLVLSIFGAIAFFFIVPAIVVQKVDARPKYMRLYNASPYSRKNLRNDCTICHIGKGGAENTQFGLAFDDAGRKITSDLRATYPTFFVKKSKVKSKK
jgi:hypothetical protein